MPPLLISTFSSAEHLLAGDLLWTSGFLFLLKVRYFFFLILQVEEEFLISCPQGDLVKANLQDRVWVFTTLKLILPDTTQKREGLAAISDVNRELI